MSTILKALRRLEEEKANAEPGRPLREQVAATPPIPPTPSRRGWPRAVAALVLSALAGSAAIWWLFGSGAVEEPEVASARPPAAEAVAAAAPAPVAPAPAAPRGTAVPSQPGDAYSSDVEVVARPDPQPRLADADPVAPRPPPSAGARRPVEDSAAAQRQRESAIRARMAARETLRAEQAGVADPEPARPPESSSRVAAASAPVTETVVSPVPIPDPVVREAAPESAPAPKPVAEPAPAPVQKAAPAPKPEPAPVVASAEPVPPPKPRAAAPESPSILVERTKWHPVADRRTAWLRVGGTEHEVVEGDVVEGLLVGEIQPSGVVFQRDGESLRRGVGER